MKLFESRIGPSVFKSYYLHAEKVFETVENMNACVKAACEGEEIEEHIAATSKSELEADVDEQIKVVKLTYNEIVNKIKNHEIIDLKTISAFNIFDNYYKNDLPEFNN